ncbi:MAG: winged helix-turn-helix domain-containing protein [Anaerolineae bacterium]
MSGRQADLQRLCLAASACKCVSLVGMSNVGKSFLLRALCQAAPASLAPGRSLVYVDCNRMVEFSEQGFYELVLRCLSHLAAGALPEPAVARLAACHADVIAPSTPFLGHLRFTEGLAAALEACADGLILVLDEFDACMRSLDDRVLLNLRALRDTYPERLAYITATRRRLESMRRAHGAVEFAELFAHTTMFLAPLDRQGTTALVEKCASTYCLAVGPDDVSLLMDEAGGHPALVIAAAHGLSRLRRDAAALGRPLHETYIREQLDADPACHDECLKLWHDLDSDERAVLLSAGSCDSGGSRTWQALDERYLIQTGGPAPRPFCRLFAGYVQRHRLAAQTHSHGIRVDVDAGEVWIDGHRLPPLTDLEYRLLLLLYGRLGQLVDKYTIVEAVWGQSYLDEIDDARIEKLVSRLRAKIEADPARPRFLHTIRGRGYRLTNPATWA